MKMDVGGSAVPVGVAARIAALKRRQGLQRQHGRDSDSLELQQQQQQWCPDMPGADHSSGLPQQPDSSSKQSLAARLAVLQTRGNIGTSTSTALAAAPAADAAAMPRACPSHASEGIHPCSVGQSAPSDIMDRLKVLQQRTAPQQIDLSELQHPEDFVQCLQNLLSQQDFTQHLESQEGCEQVTAAMLAEQGAGVNDPSGSSSDEGSPCGGERPAPPTCTSPPGPINNKQNGQQSDQQQEQQHDSSSKQQQQATLLSPDSLIPGHVRRLLVLAAQSLSAEQFVEAAQRATAAQSAAVAALSTVGDDSSSTALSSFCREADKVFAAAVLLDLVPQQQWLAALQLDKQSVTAVHKQQHDINQLSTAAAGVRGSVVSAGDVQRAYRRLAGLIHPDKFRHPAAESAFKALAQAVEQALAAVGGSSSRGLAAASDDDDGHTNDDDHDDDYAWWSEWERDVSQGHVDGAAAAGGGGGSTAPTAADEEQELWNISMQDLVAEVDRRQSSVLKPSCPADAARSSVERHRRLRVARTVLAERVKQLRQQAAAAAAGVDVNGDAAGGGFLAEDDDGGGGVDYSIGGGGSGVTSHWKRQRT